MTRRNKRLRNKSSPQVTSLPKKQRNQSVGDQSENEQADSISDLSVESAADIGKTPVRNRSDTSVLSTVTDSNSLVTLNSIPESFNMATAMEAQDQDQEFRNQILESSASAAVQSTSQMVSSQVNMPLPPSQMSQMSNPPFPPQFMNQPTQMDASLLMQASQPMGFPYIANQVQTRLSDEDVVRIASQLKSLLKQEIEQLVEVKIRLATEPLKQQVNDMQITLNQLKSDLKEVIEKNDELEQYSRRSCLRVSGINESDNENVTEKIIHLASRTGADITARDIDRAHRVGKKNTGRNRQADREIIIKFSTYDARLKFLKSRTKLREKNEKIYINEDLTKFRKNLAYECRDLRRKKLIKNTWVFGGNIYVEENSGNKVPIRGLNDIEKYCVSQGRP